MDLSKNGTRLIGPNGFCAPVQLGQAGGTLLGLFIISGLPPYLSDDRTEFLTTISTIRILERRFAGEAS